MMVYIVKVHARFGHVHTRPTRNDYNTHIPVTHRSTAAAAAHVLTVKYIYKYNILKLWHTLREEREWGEYSLGMMLADFFHLPFLSYSGTKLLLNVTTHAHTPQHPSMARCFRANARVIST